MWNLLLYVLSVVTVLILYYFYEEKSEDDEDEKNCSLKKADSESSKPASPLKTEPRFSIISLLSSFSSGDEKQDETTFLERFSTFDEVTNACKSAGLERCNLILGIDYSASNEWQGRKTFSQGCLHKLSGNKIYNPYQKVIWVFGQTLAPLDEDGKIPAFGFGDYETRNHNVFCLNKSGDPCHGFGDVLECYNQVCQNVYYGGPTSFAPIIEKSISIVNESGNKYHILVIITDGQLPEEELTKTTEALIKASRFPLSIIAIGVGDGPWKQLQKLEDFSPEKRHFSNFRFVDYYKTTNKVKHPDALLALNALMDIPDQYKKITDLGYIHKTTDFCTKYEHILHSSLLSLTQTNKPNWINKLKHRLNNNK